MIATRLNRYGGAVACGLLSGIVAVLFLHGAPMGGAFSWPDSPRHALNGAFVLDLLRAAPFDNPVQFAYDYYSQYPALTILFYPPLYYFLLAPLYALFGVSQGTALLLSYLCYAFLACGAYFFVRFWLQPVGAFGVALILTAAPDVGFWGRQVMLEVPAFAFITWSAYSLVRYLHDRRIGFLYLAIGLLVLALYIKLSVAFMALPYLICLFAARGWDMFSDRHNYIIAALAIVSLVPLVAITIGFGQTNIQSTLGIADAKASRASFDGWIWYAERMPGQLGWPAFVSALAFPFLWVLRGCSGNVRRANALLLSSWLVIGYLFFSAIDLKEARHSIFLLLPLSLAAGMSMDLAIPKRAMLSGLLTVALGAATLVITVSSRPVHFVDGYRRVVEFVAEKAPKNSNVVFSGYRDGAFIFNMRAYGNRPDVAVIRADKLLLRISVRRKMGVEQTTHSEDEIRELIGSLAAHYVVAQPDFWTDLEQMRRLQAVLQGSGFKMVARFPMVTNYKPQEKELIVYQNMGPVAKGPVNITYTLPIIGRSISGSTSGD